MPPGVGTLQQASGVKRGEGPPEHVSRRRGRGRDERISREGARGMDRQEGGLQRGRDRHKRKRSRAEDACRSRQAAPRWDWGVGVGVGVGVGKRTADQPPPERKATLRQFSGQRRWTAAVDSGGG